ADLQSAVSGALMALTTRQQDNSPHQQVLTLDQLSGLDANILFNGFNRPGPLAAPPVTSPPEHPSNPTAPDLAHPVHGDQDHAQNEPDHPMREGTPAPSAPLAPPQPESTTPIAMAPRTPDATAEASAGAAGRRGRGAHKRPAPYPSASEERPNLPNSLSFDAVPIQLRVQGMKDPRHRFMSQRVRRDRRPTIEFMANKKDQIGDEKYHQVLAGIITLEQAMGPDYSVQQDPDRGKLISVPRTVTQRGFTKALRLHYHYLVQSSIAVFPEGVPLATAGSYR
ncbi:3744_t:CDS:2, partial [Acaulospora colombiana]